MDMYNVYGTCTVRIAHVQCVGKMYSVWDMYSVWVMYNVWDMYIVRDITLCNVQYVWGM